MKYLEAHREVILLAHKIFNNDKDCNGLDHSWKRIDQETGRVSIGLTVKGIRVQIQRVVGKDDDPQKIALDMNAELLVLIDDVYEKDY